MYCQSEIEGGMQCPEQCSNCKEYYTPLEKISIGDIVQVIANVDNNGRIGDVLDTAFNDKYPIQVDFGDGIWCCYKPDELKKIKL